METTSIFDVLLAIATILATFGTAIATFVAVRNQVKTTNIDTMKTDKMLTVEVAERVNAMSLSFAEKLEEQLTDCRTRTEALESKLGVVAEEATEIKLRLKFLITQLKTVVERHGQYCNSDCSGFEEINHMLEKIIDELESSEK